MDRHQESWKGEWKLRKRIQIVPVNKDEDFAQWRVHPVACRDRSKAIVGVPPGEVLSLLESSLVLRKKLDELEWAEAHWPPADYAMLTVSRAW